MAFTIKNPNQKWIVTGDDGVTQLETIISTVIGLLTISAVLYLTIQLILAGYAFISAQGEADKLKKARNQITQSLLGIALVIIAIGLARFFTDYVGLTNVFDLNKTLDDLNL